MQTTIVSADWLMAQPEGAVRLFDASYFLPTMGRSGPEEYARAHIPGAVFFDIDGIKDEASDLPHMIPSADVFQAAMRDLGLNDGDQVVVYDDSPFLSSARAWWMLRYFGHLPVAVLDGGLRAWREAGGAVTAAVPALQDGNFTTSSPVQADVITFAELEHQLQTGTVAQIVDARAADRFAGIAPEPRAGLRSGHIPGSLNLPIGDILDKKTGRLKPADQLDALFAQAGLVKDKPAITTCGSGVTAAGLTLALAILGKTDIRLYDGSWSEWGASHAPIET